jgi:hypothetical protein
VKLNKILYRSRSNEVTAHMILTPEKTEFSFITGLVRAFTLKICSGTFQGGNLACSFSKLHRSDNNSSNISLYDIMAGIHLK